MILYVVLVALLVVLGLVIERRPVLWTRGPVFWGLSAVGFATAIVLFAVVGPTLPGAQAYDVTAYWHVDLADPYARSFGQISELGAFRYTPPMAFLLAPLSLLPLWWVAALFTLGLFAVLVRMTGRYALAAMAFLAVPVSIFEGNVDILIAAAVVAGFRYPAAWAFVLLTKVTPGVGLLWFVVRREWRSLAIALGATALFVLPSLLRPDLWASWLAMLRDNAALPDYSVVPLWARLAAAAAMIVIAARTDRPWLVGIAVAVAQPTTVLRMLAVAVASVGIGLRRHDAVGDRRPADDAEVARRAGLRPGDEECVVLGAVVEQRPDRPGELAVHG